MMAVRMIPELIKKKRDGQELAAEELDELINGYVRGIVPDYQMSAFLMAVFFQGMSSAETAHLVRLMRDSGQVLDLSFISAKKVDKHSTGGVGDKVSLVLAPLLASLGIVVPMISGRSLGHSGGTLDKLESIPGLRTDISSKKFCEVVEKVGFVIAGQSEELVPADRKIYALRDATATVESPPLVVASILSKKFAEDLDGLVLDIKTGRGAFFSSQEAALDLGGRMIRTAAQFGVPVRALLSNMEQPLGFTAGNWVEVEEALACLKGQGPSDTMSVVTELAIMALQLAGHTDSDQVLREKIDKQIATGQAFARFEEYVSRLGGNIRYLQTPGEFPLPKPVEIRAPRSGFVQVVDALAIGRTAMLAGAGRQKTRDTVDPCAGIILEAKIGDRVDKGQRLARLFSRKSSRSEELTFLLQSAFRIGDEAPPPSPVIFGEITRNGELLPV